MFEFGTFNPLRDFARQLAASQEPLGEGFAQVLHANLWDLYVRSDTPKPAPMQWYLDQLGDA